MTLVPGTMLGEKYRVERVIGSGGMGVVVAATHAHLHQQVAIKVLHEGARTRRDAIMRFLREARTTMKLESEHVVRVLDVDMLDGTTPFIVMELLDGEDMSSVLARSGRLEPSEAVDVVLEACEAIAEAHSLGVVHRDLKPANLFRARRRDGTMCIKLLDFGVSKIRGEEVEDDVGMRTEPDSERSMPVAARAKHEAESLTSTNVALGSPRYMSPEQIRSARDVDARADIWGLGVVLYELVSGVPAFSAPDVSALRHAIERAEWTPLERVRPGVPRALADAVERCLRTDPTSRFPDVASFAQALGRCASPAGRMSIARIEREHAVARERRFPAWVSIAFALAGAIGVIAFASWRVRAAASTTAEHPANTPRSSAIALATVPSVASVAIATAESIERPAPHVVRPTIAAPRTSVAAPTLASAALSARPLDRAHAFETPE